MHEAAAKLKIIAAEAGLTPLALAVAWVARHKGITAPIISARNQAQLAPSLQATEIDMNDQLYQVLCDLAPHPATGHRQTRRTKGMNNIKFKYKFISVLLLGLLAVSGHHGSCYGGGPCQFPQCHNCIHKTMMKLVEEIT